MKLTLYQLEIARRNPQRFVEVLAATAQEKKKVKFNSKQFRTYLTEALGAYHNGKSWPGIMTEFSRKCREKLVRIHYHNDRTDGYEKTLKSYFRTYPAQGVTFIEMGKRFSLPAGPHLITGKVDRFDLRSPQGYRATDIQTSPNKSWRRKLRWPLIQQALALEMNGSAAEVEVGVHCFETGVPDYHIFEHAELEAALAEAESICDEVSGYAEDYDIDDIF